MDADLAGPVASPIMLKLRIELIDRCLVVRQQQQRQHRVELRGLIAGGDPSSPRRVAVEEFIKVQLGRRRNILIVGRVDKLSFAGAIVLSLVRE